MPRPTIKATQLVTALMDMAGLAEVVLTEDVLDRVAHDELDIASNKTDPILRPGAYRLRVLRQRSRIVVPGALAVNEITGGRRSTPSTPGDRR